MNTKLITRPKPIKVSPLTLRPIKSDTGSYISVVKSNRNPMTVTQTPVKESTLELPINVLSFNHVIASKVFNLLEVKDQPIEVEYKILTQDPNQALINWDSLMPDVPLIIEIKVARACVKIHFPCIYMEKSHKKVTTTFRRATDVRGYHDTYVPAHWNISDVCFYIRTLIFNYIVDSNPLNQHIMILQAISWKYDILSKERLTLISGGSYKVSEEDIEKLKNIQAVEQKYVL
jgi:hypothetical protein